MRSLKSLVFLAFVVCFCPAVSPIEAQAAPHNIYLLIPSETDYTLSAVSIPDGKTTVLYSLPTEQRGILLDIFPRDEVKALTDFLDIADAAQLSQSAPWGRVSSMAVSPDNRQVALNIKYTVCYRRIRFVCFGTSQLMLIDSATGHQKMILNLGSHDSRFIEADMEEPGVKLRAMQWLPDQKAIVARIINTSYGADDSIVLIPVDGTPPFKIGDGKAWAISPDSNQIAILSRNDHQVSGFLSTLHLVDLDWRTNHYTDTPYVLTPYYISDGVGMAYSEKNVIFEVNLDTRGEEGGGGLGIFDTLTGKYQLILPDQNFTKLQSRPDGSRLIAQNADGKLVEVLLKNHSASMQQITDSAVANWDLNGDGNVLVQYTVGSSYEIMLSEDQRYSSFTMADPLGLIPAELRNDFMVDW